MRAALLAAEAVQHAGTGLGAAKAASAEALQLGAAEDAVGRTSGALKHLAGRLSDAEVRRDAAVQALESYNAAVAAAETTPVAAGSPPATPPRAPRGLEERGSGTKGRRPPRPEGGSANSL